MLKCNGGIPIATMSLTIFDVSTGASMVYAGAPCWAALPGQYGSGQAIGLSAVGPATLVVQDLEASRAFYQTVFAAAVTWGGQMSVVRLPGGAMLRLVSAEPCLHQPFDAVVSQTPAPLAPQHVKLPLTVRSAQQWEAIRMLSETRVREWRSGHRDGSIAWLRDLDGHHLELTLNKADSTCDGSGID